MRKNSTIGIVEANEYHDLEKILSPHLIRLIEENYESISSLKSVLIKPNVNYPSTLPINTDPRLVLAVCDFLDRHGINNVRIGEGSGVGVDTKEAFYVSGYHILEERGYDLIDLKRGRELVIKDPYLGKIKIPKLVKDSDMYINIAKAKTHVLTTVSLCLKNQKGLLGDADHKKFHMLDLNRSIAALAVNVRPDLCIIDGITGIEDVGPGPGLRAIPTRFNTIVIGNDIVTTDSTMCGRFGVDPLGIPHVSLAHELGVGKIKPDKQFGDLELLDKPLGTKMPKRYYNVNRYGLASLGVLHLTSDSRDMEDKRMRRLFDIEVIVGKCCSGCTLSLKSKTKSVLVKALKHIHLAKRRIVIFTGIFTSKDLQEINRILRFNISKETKAVLLLYGNCAIKTLRTLTRKIEVEGCPPLL